MSARAEGTGPIAESFEAWEHLLTQPGVRLPPELGAIAFELVDAPAEDRHWQFDPRGRSPLFQRGRGLGARLRVRCRQSLLRSLLEQAGASRRKEPVHLRGDLRQLAALAHALREPQLHGRG